MHYLDNHQVILLYFVLPLLVLTFTLLSLILHLPPLLLNNNPNPLLKLLHKQNSQRRRNPAHILGIDTSSLKQIIRQIAMFLLIQHIYHEK